MKNLFLVLILLGCVLTACQTHSSKPKQEVPQAIDYEAEKTAIMAVIEAESAGFWNKDFDEYASYWAHGPHVRTMGWWPTGGVTVVEGWEERAKRTRDHMVKSPEPNPSANNVIRKNINLRIFKDVAWMTFDQYGEDTGDSLMDMAGRSRETRILEKENGKWKIAYVGWLLEDAKQ